MGLVSEEPREITLPDLRLVGAAAWIDFREGEDAAAFPGVWERFYPQLPTLESARTNPGRLFGLNLFPPGFPGDRRWYYAACAEVDSLERDYSPAFVSRFVPAGTHLSFEVSGTSAEIAPAFDRAWQIVCERSGGAPSCSVNLELYDERFRGPEDPDSRMDLLFMTASHQG